MPENKPMKMQWLTVDGRQVPSILPNHWNEQKNDWDITGTKNPLPIANYTQNASGVWLPTSESNPMPTQLTGSIVDVVSLLAEPIVVTSGTRIQLGVRQIVRDYVAFALSTRKSSAEGRFEYRTAEGLYRMDNGFTEIEGSFDRGFTDKIGIIVSELEIHFNNTSESDQTLEAVYLHLFRR